MMKKMIGEESVMEIEFALKAGLDGDEERFIITDTDTGESVALLQDEARELAWRLIKYFLKD